MKIDTLFTLLFAACLVTTASAQTPTLVNGHKVLVDRNGRIIQPAQQATQPPSAPLVGGADSCVTPDVIVGLGSFSYDNTLATTGVEGQSEALCLAFSSTTLDNDVWFTWTATYTGILQVNTCTSFDDTKIAAYSGSTCPVSGSALACNEDSCGLQSSITFSVTSGNSYVIQLGDFPGAAGGVGTFSLVQPPPPPTNDSCTTPITIVGLGSFPYDTTMATTGIEGQNESLCNQFGVIGISTDLWYTWVAPFSGTARVSNCGATNGDTKFAAYAGAGCPVSGTAIACNDQACGSNASQIDFVVTQGSAYTLEIGDFPGATAGVGTFTTSQAPPLPTNNDCSTPLVLSGPGTQAFDLSSATTSAQQPSCPVAENDLWYAYTSANTGSATITACGLTTTIDQDTVMAVYAGPGCGGAEISCDDDDTACGLESTVTWNTTCGSTYMIQVGGFDTGSTVAGSFNISETGTPCGPTGVPYCFGDGTGTACPCANNGALGNGCASSVNANGANLTTSGNSSLANDTLVLLGTGMSNSSCLYFQGTSQVSSVFGDGLRCAGGVVTRLGTKTNVGGSSQYPTAGNPSISVRGAVTAPGTRSYQTWYRNAAPFCTPSTFNLTNGVQITWQ